MKRASVILLCCALLIALGTTASAQQLNEVLSKYYAAIGGMEKWKSVAQCVVRGKTVNSSGSWKRPYTMSIKQGKVRNVMNVQPGIQYVQAFDGNGGWSINPWSSSLDAFPMNEDDAKELALQAEMFQNDLIAYKEKGTTLELMGKDDIDGSDCFKIVATRKDGVIRIYYIDVDSYLIVKVTTKRKEDGVDTESSSFYSNYRVVNGIMVPYAVEGSWGGGFQIEVYDFNASISDDSFSMPQSKEKKMPNTSPSPNP